MALVTLTVSCTRVHCVVRGSLIATPTGEVPVESLQLGELVLGQNDDGALVSATVTAAQSASAREYLSIQVQGLSRPLTVTDVHRVATRRGWRPAKRLRLNDEVRTTAGFRAITRIEHREGPVEVFDLGVTPTRNFVVDGVLVHNKSIALPPEPEEVRGLWVGQTSYGAHYRLFLDDDGGGQCVTTIRKDQIVHYDVEWMITDMIHVHLKPRDSQVKPLHLQGGEFARRMSLHIVHEEEWGMKILFQREDDLERVAEQLKEALGR